MRAFTTLVLLSGTIAVFPCAAQPSSAAQVSKGQTRFGAECGFCHGRDALGGETGPDLSHSSVVAEDVRGNRLGPFLQTGRPASGMPSFSLSSSDVNAIAAFLHDVKTKAASLNGQRRGVDATDLRTGDAQAGKKFFEGEGGCVRCHSLSGSFAQVGTRYQGLALLQRMLYPRPRATNPLPGPAQATVTTSDGKRSSGKVLYRDEFTITLVDSDGWSHSWPLTAIQLQLDDPLRAHWEQLAKYTDAQIHDVYAFLEGLK